MLRPILKFFGSGLRAGFALIGIFAMSAAVANYTATQGTGTNFGSIIIGGVNFASQLICDFTTANQCAAVKAASTAPSATDQALVVVASPNGNQATAANQTTGNTSLATIANNTGAATPAGSNLIGKVSDQWNTGNANAQPHLCGSFVFVHITSNTDTQIVAPISLANVYICDYKFSFTGVGAFYLESSTSSSCGGTLVQTDINWTGLASTPYSKTNASAFYQGLNAGASNGLCVHTSGLSSTDVDVGVYYDQY
jgi:hypothetical protein